MSLIATGRSVQDPLRKEKYRLTVSQLESLRFAIQSKISSEDRRNQRYCLPDVSKVSVRSNFRSWDWILVESIGANSQNGPSSLGSEQVRHATSSDVPALLPLFDRHAATIAAAKSGIAARRTVA